MSYPTSQILAAKVDNVTDVLAVHVNELQTVGVNMTLRHIKNNSGSTVAANDVGYIDDAGEFKLTATAYLDGVSWAVVIVGGVHTDNIVVAVGGSNVVIVLDGNCSAGDFLYTSGTTKQAKPQSYMRPEMFAIATTANSSGAGGTCVALLHCGRKPIVLSSANDILKISGATDSDWKTTQNGAVAAAVVTYNVALVSGSEDSIVPTSSSQLGKLVLHNVTKTEEAFISSVNIGANTITVTDAADIVGWADTNVLEVRSQTNTSNRAAAYFFDIEVTSTDLPTLAVALLAETTFTDTGATGSENEVLHPFEANAASKRMPHTAQVASIPHDAYLPPIPLIQRRFCNSWIASGAGTATVVLRLRGAWIATP